MSYIQTEYKFGAKSIREIDGPYSLATGIIESDDSTTVITTPGDLFRFESNKYKDRFFYKFVATAYSRNNNCLFGVTENPSTLVAISLSEIGHPIIKGHSISQDNVKRMFFFEKSKMLIIIGDSVRCYGVFFSPFSIYLDKIFPDEVLLTKPSIADFENEIIYLFTNSGYSAYDLSGVISQQSFFLDSIEYYSNEIEDGLILDSEHIIFLLNNISVNAVNVKTKKNFEIIQFTEKANRLFLSNEQTIALCFDGKITFYKIDLFWKTWVPSIPNPIKINRCNKQESAARILVQCENSSVYFISPRDGLEIAKIESPDQTLNFNTSVKSNSSQYFYDRGYYIYTQFKGSNNSHVYRIKETTRRERLFLVSKEGLLTIYNTNVWPFEKIKSEDISAKSVTICKFEDGWTYLISTKKNDLLIMNPKTLEIGKKFQVTGPPIISIDYYYPTNLVLLIREKELTFYDLKKDFPLCRLAVNKFSAIKFNGEIIYLGFENGSVERILMNNRALKSKDKVKGHDAPVIDFAFSSSFFLSSASDGTICVWDYKLHAIFTKIYLPIQANCLCVINGHKDVVVGIDDAIMLLDRNLFLSKNKKEEKESKIIDSYDTIKDRFVPISAQDPVRPNDFSFYPLNSIIAPSEEFPIAIFTFRPSSQPLSIRSPQHNTQSIHSSRSPRNLLGSSRRSDFNTTPNRNKNGADNEEYEYDKYDYIEYDEENNKLNSNNNQVDFLDFGINNQNDSNSESRDFLQFDDDDENPNNENHISNNTYNASFPAANDDEISDNEEFTLDEFQKQFSQPVSGTPMRRPDSKIPQTHRIIVSPLLTDGPVENIQDGDSLFANTQPESGMPITGPIPMTITKSLRVFADDADSDSDNDEFFKERFPLRSRNSLYIESTRAKKRVPYIPIPTDLYETTKPKLKPHVKIVTPKAETPKRKPPVIRT